LVPGSIMSLQRAAAAELCRYAPHSPLPTTHYPLILLLEVLQCLARVEVEDGLAGGEPFTALEEEDGRGVAQVADGRQPFHVASLDCLKLDCDRHESHQLPGMTIAGQFQLL